MTRNCPALWRRKFRRTHQAPGLAETACGIPRWVTVAGAALAVVVAGCSASIPVNAGPFGGAGNGGYDCVPHSHPGEILTEGFNDVSDSWRGTVAVISKVSLVRPRGLRLMRTYAVRLGNHPAYGDMPGLPSVGVGAFSYPAWKHHVNAAGARVAYARHVAFQTNLLLVVKTSAANSSDQGINVWYHVGTRHYHLRTRFGLKLMTRC
jgi:hypothetical protein